MLCALWACRHDMKNFVRSDTGTRLVCRDCKLRSSRAKKESSEYNNNNTRFFFFSLFLLFTSSPFPLLSSLLTSPLSPLLSHLSALPLPLLCSKQQRLAQRMQRQNDATLTPEEALKLAFGVYNSTIDADPSLHAVKLALCALARTVAPKGKEV